MGAKRTWIAIGAVVCFGLALVSAHAVTPGDAERGGVIAKRWCASCHVVSPDQKTGNSDVPSFASVARNKRLNSRSLTAFLSNPHPKMPDMSLTRSEIADIVAYINSLGHQR